MPLAAGLLLMAARGSFAVESYLDNGVVKVGIELTKGGSITYLSKSGTTDNVINNHDLGLWIRRLTPSSPTPRRRGK